MLNNIKELRDSLKKIKDLKNTLDTDGNTDPMNIFKDLGIDVKNLDKEFADQMRLKVTLRYQKDGDNPELQYHYQSDSGFDLRANETVTLEPFERKLVPTGIFFEIPEGYEIQVRPKSGLTIKRGLTVLNTPGTIDQGYTGEIKCIIINMDKNPQTIEKGDKIAQAVLCPVMTGRNVKLQQIDKIEDKERKDNGFGSTGN